MCIMSVDTPNAVEDFKRSVFIVNPSPIEGLDRYQWYVKRVVCKWLDYRAIHVGYVIQFTGFETENM